MQIVNYNFERKYHFNGNLCNASFGEEIIKYSRSHEQHVIAARSCIKFAIF
jgi:hypothetical protein